MTVETVETEKEKLIEALKNIGATIEIMTGDLVIASLRKEHSVIGDSCEMGKDLWVIKSEENKELYPAKYGYSATLLKGHLVTIFSPIES